VTAPVSVPAPDIELAGTLNKQAARHTQRSALPPVNPTLTLLADLSCWCAALQPVTASAAAASTAAACHVPRTDRETNRPDLPVVNGADRRKLVKLTFQQTAASGVLPASLSSSANTIRHTSVA
jgi:hypothetical protein